MISNISKLRTSCRSGYWSDRIISQLEYAGELVRFGEQGFEADVESAAAFLLKRSEVDGVIGKELCSEAEEMLSNLRSAAKRYRQLFAGHAHIDMNWFWRWDETVAIVLDTFRTVLRFMHEYPQFKFSQSQASVYWIVERFDPTLLEQIRVRIAKGQWEVTASDWVEADKNMPNGESNARHILYTKRYLAELLGIAPERMCIAFEPDAPGHSINLPEILTRGGIRFYYHYRISTSPHLYRWKAPSGSTVIAYREPVGFSAAVQPSMAIMVPEFCSRYGIKTFLTFYGVGNHGGGPTRRDIERILDMQQWPIFPEIVFGTVADFFSSIAPCADSFSEYCGELNFVNTGAFTSQSRIKMGNRICEATLDEAETWSSFACLNGAHPYASKDFVEAWRNVLFCQFHDILTGTCSMDSREYTMGRFQEALAIAGTQRTLSLERIAASINTRTLAQQNDAASASTSEGAGAAFGLREFNVSQCERGRGTARVYHVFNPSHRDRDEVTELVVWDWGGDPLRIRITDEQGNKVDHQYLDPSDHPYEYLYFSHNDFWRHAFCRLLVRTKVPAFGYRTLVVEEDRQAKSRSLISDEQRPGDPRVEAPEQYVLENRCLRAEFNPLNGRLIALTDKASGRSLIDGHRPAGAFRLIRESDEAKMTSWIVGRHRSIEMIDVCTLMTRVPPERGTLRQTLRYRLRYQNTTLSVSVTLDADAPELRYDVQCDWFEPGRPGEGVPQLSFMLPLGYRSDTYLYDVPCGTVRRKGMHLDVPANSWVAALPQGKASGALMVTTDSKYGFRCNDDTLSISLLRSSYDPDPYPEIGMHRFRFGLRYLAEEDEVELIGCAREFSHPLRAISSTFHEGTIPPAGSWMQIVEGSVVVSTIKFAEQQSDHHRLVVRLYEVRGHNSAVTIRFASQPRSAYRISLTEERIADSDPPIISTNAVRFNMAPFVLTTLCVEFTGVLSPLPVPLP